jgi:hypothetical protein
VEFLEAVDNKLIEVRTVLRDLQRQSIQDLIKPTARDNMDKVPV